MVREKNRAAALRERGSTILFKTEICLFKDKRGYSRWSDVPRDFSGHLPADTVKVKNIDFF